MKTATKTSSPSTPSLEALAAEQVAQVFRDLETSVDSVNCDNALTPFYLAVMAEFQGSNYSAMLDRITKALGIDFTHALENAVDIYAKSYEQHGYLLGVEIGKRLAGGVR